MRDYRRYLTEVEREGVRGFIERLKRFLGASLLDLRIFGSKVRGDFERESDIDIFVVIDSEDWHIREAISNIAANVNMEYNCNISPVIYSKKEHEKNRYFQILLIQEVEREGVSLA